MAYTPGDISAFEELIRQADEAKAYWSAELKAAKAALDGKEESVEEPAPAPEPVEEEPVEAEVVEEPVKEETPVVEAKKTPAKKATKKS